MQFYVHPVFIGAFSETHGYEIMFFTGHRWVLGSTVNMVMKNKNPDDLEAIVALFEQSTFWLEDLPPDTFEFVSEPVPASNDQGTPLGLRWHHSRYVEGEIFPYADISRPSDAIFQCGKCSAKNNPCLYEGACLDDGTCLCKYGASGNLCDIKPLGDGECNPYFNLESDEYDEGDCCVASCAGQSCGAGELNFAFGQELERDGTGFPYCVDPSMVPMSIRFNTNIDDEENLIFFSYTLEIRCGGQEVPLRVVLDPLITGGMIRLLQMSKKKQREDRALQEKSYLGQPMRDAHKGTGIKVGVGIPTEVVQVMLEMNGFGWNSCGKNGKPILGRSACNTTIGGGFWTQRSTIFSPIVVVILVILVILLAVFVSRFDIRLAERIHGDTLLLVAIFVSKSCKFGHYGVNVLVSGFQQRDLFVLCIDRFHKLTQS